MDIFDRKKIHTRRFHASLSELQHVRRYVKGLMSGHPAADDAIMAVSELAANAIEHSASADSGGFTVQVTHLEGAVRIAVHDAGGPEQPKLVHSSLDTTRGRGLFIVDSISRRWGVAQGAARATVWCEIECVHAPATATCPIAA
uniref:ATP-binding protein n=1 Tax=Nonomuraea bangladeshensis TaxID=404385 RepID=UPI003F497C76